MKSRLPVFLAILCAIFAAPRCPAQNATPDSATPPVVYLQIGTTQTNGIPYQPGLTLAKFLNDYFFNGLNLKWADLAHVQITHANGTPPATVDFTTIAQGRPTDIPLSPGDSVLIPLNPFNFPGGNPWALRDAVQNFFGVDWSMAVIPEEMSNIRIPKFSIPNPSSPRDVISLYNEIGEKVPSLGQWFYKGDSSMPEEGDTYTLEVLMLIPDKTASAAASTPNAKAIAIADIPKDKWDTISHDIEDADLTSQEFAGSHEPHSTGRLLFQDDSKILVVIGPPAYIELAESVITAFRDNAKIALAEKLSAAGLAPDNGTSTSPPSSPPK